MASNIGNNQTAKVICATCQKPLVIDLTLVGGELACSECGELLPLDAYPPIAAVRLELAAKREAERRREAKLREEEKRQKKAQKEAERQKRDQHRQEEEEQAQRQYALELQILEQQGREIDRKFAIVRRERLRHRASEEYSNGWAIGVFIFATLSGIIFGGNGCDKISRAETVFQEMSGRLSMVVGAMCVLCGLVILGIGTATRALADKLDALRDVVEKLGENRAEGKEQASPKDED